MQKINNKMIIWVLANLDTGILNGTLESSQEKTTLESQGCTKRNNKDYGANRWMACPKGYYVAAISDDDAPAQDVFCCPFS